MTLLVNGQIPGGSFESWDSVVFESPTYADWTVYQDNTSPASVGLLQKSDDASDGNYAIKFETFGTKDFGYVVYGEVGNEGPAGGFPFADNPTQVTLSYKCNMATGDSAQIWVWLYSGGSQLTMDGYKVGGIHSVYKDTTFNLSTYAGMPDSLMFAVVPCDPMVEEIRTNGNTVFFDNVRFNGTNNVQLPDSSFESWTSRVQYFTKEMYNMQALTTKSTDAYNGMYALIISTTNVQWDESRSQLGMNNILALWGKEDWIEISPDNYKLNISGGLPIEERKDTLVVYYKYMPSEGVTDTAMINLKFQKADTEAITYYNELMASESYKKFEIPFDLDNNWTMTSIDADSMILELGSSKYRNGFTEADTVIEGSSLTIDYMYFKSQYYPQTATAGVNGSVTPSDTGLIRGSSIMFIILPDIGYDLDSVTYNDVDIMDELVQEGDGYTFTIDSVTGSGTLYADFNKLYFVQTATAGSNGSITPADTSLALGSNITFTILPDNGYELDSVTYNNVDVMDELVQQGNGYTYTIDSITEPGSLYVGFKNLFYIQTATAGSNGSITPADTSLILGSNITFTILPDNGYELNSATYNSVDIMDELVQEGNGFTFTIDSVTGTGTLSVDFNKLPTGLENNSYSGENITFYPNPTKGMLYLRGISQDCTVELLSVTGAVVFQETISENSMLDISAIPEGMYLVRINHTILGKILKQ